MNAGISLNRYAPNIFALKALKLSPLARETFGIIANLLCCAIGSVSRAVTELVKAGLIRRTGAFHAFLFQVVEITPRGKKYAPQENFSLPETSPLQASHENVTPPLTI